MTDAEIYESLRWDLIRYATALAGPDDAPDLVSGAVTNVLHAKGGLAELRDAKPYLMRAILNEARMRHRSRTRRPAVVMANVPDVGHAPDHDHVLDVVQALPPRQRAATFLVYYEQYTPTEAAEAMGCRPATVRRYLSIARDKLREALLDDR